MLLVFCLLAGLIITVALELVLTSLGAAISLSIIGFSPETTSDSDSPEAQNSQSDFSFPLTHLVGFGVALSLTVVLFCSSFAVTEFGQIDEPNRGIIFGIILWSTYWLFLIWLSSTTIASIADSLIGSASLGSKRLFSALYKAVNGEESQLSPELATLHNLASEVSKISKRQKQLPEILAQQREMILNEMRDEHVSRAQASFQKEHQKSLASESSETVSDDLDTSTPSTVSRIATRSMSAIKSALSSTISEFDLPSWKELLRNGMNQWDWSEWDLETLWYQLQTLTPEMSSKLIQNAIIRDAENYIQNTPSWSLQLPLLESEFYEQLYDSQAAPQETKNQLMQLSRERFLGWLKARGDLSPQKLDSIADTLSEVRDKVLDSLALRGDQSIENKEITEIQQKLINYCRYTNRDSLTSQGIANKVRDLLERVQNQSLCPVDQALNLDEIRAVLIKRQGIEEKQWRSLIQSLRDTWSESCDRNSVLEEFTTHHLPRPWVMRTVNSSEDLWQQLMSQLTHYLSYQEKKALTPDRIAKDLKKISKTVLRSLPDLSELSQLSVMFTSETKAILQETLEQRRDMTADEINDILNWCDSIWQETVRIAEQTLQSLLSTSELATSIPDIVRNSESILENVHHQLSEPIEYIQNKVEEKVSRVTSELQMQADAARSQAKIAAWWLFLSLLCSGISAGIAGWAATLY